MALSRNEVANISLVPSAKSMFINLIVRGLILLGP